MSTLWRCDICHDLIDPVEGDERTVMAIKVEWPDESQDQAGMDLCENCRPSDLGSHVDWLTHQMEEQL